MLQNVKNNFIKINRLYWKYVNRNYYLWKVFRPFFITVIFYVAFLFYSISILPTGIFTAVLYFTCGVYLFDLVHIASSLKRKVMRRLGVPQVKPGDLVRFIEYDRHANKKISTCLYPTDVEAKSAYDLYTIAGQLGKALDTVRPIPPKGEIFLVLEIEIRKQEWKWGIEHAYGFPLFYDPYNCRDEFDRVKILYKNSTYWTCPTFIEKIHPTIDF